MDIMDTIVIWIFNYLSYHMNAIPYIGDLDSYIYKKEGMYIMVMVKDNRYRKYYVLYNI
jgi:hypothetical protein